MSAAESNGGAATAASVPLEDLLVPHRTGDVWDWVIRVAIVAGLTMIVFASFKGRIFVPLLHGAGDGWMRTFLRPSLIWMGMGALLLVFRTVAWFFYRPFASASPDSAPSMTIIIPAYNEGAMVAQTIESVAVADYPRDRLEIFVVDDGSRDDTWWHIERAARRHPGLVTAVRFECNRGKRAALAEGFRRARGEVIVTIDSDSVIERQTLLAIAGPFRDENVGAVAGKVAVYNRREGVIPRMLHVRFILSFDMLRAVQSTYRTVYCCPGALSAYRSALLRRVLARWEAQTFLGVRSSYGEDRALTNFILDLGFDTVYQASAVVHTVVPQTYHKLCKMYLRWDRSYIREELRFARIVWKRPLGRMLIAWLDSTVTNLRYPVGYTVLVLLITLSLSDAAVLLRMLVAIGVMSGFYMLYYLRSERSWDALYGILYAYFSFFTLFWIFPYAVLTVRARSWLTR